MNNIHPTTIAPDPAADAQASRRRLPETVENLPVKIASYPFASAWLAAGCPQVRRRVYRQPATCTPAKVEA
jgi:hypothetical protein